MSDADVFRIVADENGDVYVNGALFGSGSRAFERALRSTVLPPGTQWLEVRDERQKPVNEGRFKAPCAPYMMWELHNRPPEDLYVDELFATEGAGQFVSRDDRVSRPVHHVHDPSKYLPGERVTSRPLSVKLAPVREVRPPVFTWRRVVVGVLCLVGVVGAGIGGYVATRPEPTPYTTICIDTRTSLVTNPENCTKPTPYDTPAWVPTQHADIKPLTAPPNNTKYEKPTGNVTIHPLKSTQ